MEVNKMTSAELLFAYDHYDEQHHGEIRAEILRLMDRGLEHGQGAQWVSVNNPPKITKRWKDGPNNYESSDLVLALCSDRQHVAYFHGLTWADAEGSIIEPIYWQPLPAAPPEQPQGQTPCHVCGANMIEMKYAQTDKPAGYKCEGCGATTEPQGSVYHKNGIEISSPPITAEESEHAQKLKAGQAQEA